MASDQASDDDVDALLARGGLSGAARDQVLDRVLGAVGARPPQKPTTTWAMRLSLAFGTLAVAAAAVVLVARRAPSDADPMRAKGAGAAGVELDVACRGGKLEACPIGATLIFAVNGQADGYLAAYAEPRRGGERIWYFSADAEAPRVHAAGGTTPLRRAIRVGSEHVEGTYVVRMFLTRSPRTRAALLGGVADDDVLARRELSLGVTAPLPPPAGDSHGSR